MTVSIQGCLSLHPAFPHSRTHACSPSPGAPSSQGHTRGTGVLWSLAGSDTDQSEGGTRSPRRLIHRHKGGSPGIAQNRSVLPVIHLVVTACLALGITLCQPWKPGLAQAPQDRPKLPDPQPISPQTRTLPQHTSSTGLVPPSSLPRPQAYSQPYQTAVTTLSSHARLAQAAPTLGITGFCPARGTVAPCRKWGLWLLSCPLVQSFVLFSHYLVLASPTPYS